MEGETRACLFTKEGWCLHLCVREREVIVKRIQIDEEAIQVVAQRAKHATVAGTLANFKEQSSKHFEDFLQRQACEINGPHIVM